MASSEIKYCAKCERCHDDGLRDDEDCEYYGEPSGCNHPNGGFGASENETVADIKYRIYSHWRGCENCSLEEMDGADLIAIADQFEAAHKREVAELRKCLKEALASEYGRCHSWWPCALCSENCKVKRWRKALEGAKDEGK